MAPYNVVLLKDELSLSTWLAVGAALQVLFGLAAPARYVLLPVALVFSIWGLDFALQYLGLRKSPYLRDAVRDRHSIMFRERDGSRPQEGLGTKPVAMFLIGIRSNHPLGRFAPKYRKFNEYMDELYEYAEANRATNGCKFPLNPLMHPPPSFPKLADFLAFLHLGRTPDWLNNEHAQNNTLCSISYWRSLEELEAFAREPIHIKALKFLFAVGMGPKGHELGVIHEVMVCPPGHWEAVYSNINPWGLGAAKFPMPNGRPGLQGPVYERDPKKINGMWGRMGNKLKQAEVDEKLAKVLGPGGLGG
ncbi:hypothetical protein VPNG_09625 [Cytospora leucostoma]|uniref:Uncharacterized protein n=1 Tax=Cytospora leucostoma TaxID=1230097 RepID=A0A423VRA1_9PEZI|nr:hypothetical protein VPNG_09625 [Cytospora leucostoma]